MLGSQEKSNQLWRKESEEFMTEITQNIFSKLILRQVVAVGGGKVSKLGARHPPTSLASPLMWGLRDGSETPHVCSINSRFLLT